MQPTPDGSAVIVTVDHEVDLFNATTLREALERALGGEGGVVVDLTACPFIDSTALVVLLQAAQGVEAARRRMVIACPPDSSPARLFEVTVQDVFQLAPSRSAALATLHDVAA